MTKREFFESFRDNAQNNFAYDGEIISEFNLGEVKISLFASVCPAEVVVNDVIAINSADYFTSFDFFIVLRPDMTLEEFVAEATLKLLEFIDEEKDFIVKGRPFASYLY